MVSRMDEWKLPENWRKINDRELNELAASHPGRKAHLRWQEWKTVWWAATTNEKHLIAHAIRPNGDNDLAIELIQNVRDDSVRQVYFVELYRLLQNYLASIKTLVDHSRKLVESYEGEVQPFVDQYRSLTGKLASEGVVAFLHDLRNVLLHQRLPGVGVTVSVPKPQEEPGLMLAEIILTRDDLLRLERMGAKARRYLHSQPEDFPLIQPVRDYASAVGGVTDWLAQQFEGLHGEDVRNYNEIVTHLRENFDRVANRPQ